MKLDYFPIFIIKIRNGPIISNTSPQIQIYLKQFMIMAQIMNIVDHAFVFNILNINPIRL